MNDIKYNATILKLKDKQWEKILNAASAASRAKKETTTVVKQEPIDVPGPDFDLIDDDSDFCWIRIDY